MKFLKRLVIGLILFLVAGSLLMYLFGYEYIFRGIRTTYLNGYTTAYIEDYPQFENRTIEAGSSTQPWPQHRKYNEASPTETLNRQNSALETVAFLVIRNDSIWYEDYAEEYGPDSKTNSFSMAKSIVAAMLGKAIKDNYIKDLEQPVADYYPQFDPRLKVVDLVSMSSGLNWEENYYSPFSMTAKAYFGDDLRELILNLEVTEEPGEEFEYLSGNSQLLGMVIEKATGMTLSQYLSERFWKPMGMRNDALWQLDSRESGMEKAYCCISSNARDFARFGKLYKDHGRWNGQQILDSAYVAKSIRPRFEDAQQYGYGLWLANHMGKKIFYLRGILGQYVIVIPEDNLIIVRLGHKVGDRPEEEEHSEDFYVYVEEVYNMIVAADGFQEAPGRSRRSSD